MRGRLGAFHILGSINLTWGRAPVAVQPGLSSAQTRGKRGQIIIIIIGSPTANRAVPGAPGFHITTVTVTLPRLVSFSLNLVILMTFS